MVICVPVTPDGAIDTSWGRAARVAVIRVEDGAIVADEVHPVGWDSLHDEGTEGSHHARVARFLKDQGVDVVLAGHMGPPMVRMLGQMGIQARLGAAGDARAAALAVAKGD